MSQTVHHEDNNPTARDERDQQEHPAPISFAEFAANPDRVFDDAARSTRGVTVERQGQVFRLVSLRRRSGRKRQHFNEHDALFNIIGIAQSEGPTDVSSNKHTYIAEAIAAEFEQRPPTGEPGTPPATSSDPT